MVDRLRRVTGWALLVAATVALVGLAAEGRQKVAVFVQAAAAVPTADLELVRNYASQRCAVVAGADVCAQGDLMLAQRVANAFIGDSLTVEGLTRLSGALGADYIVILRLVRWESEILYKPERSLLLLGATSFLDTSLQLLVSPLGLLFGIEKVATVGLLASVFNARGDLQFSTSVTAVDRPLLSLLTADPLEAAKEAVDSAFYQIAVAL
ncbi:MAG: hypothetical protein AB1778_06570 [Candidatus Bipolaricaulota bacterium]